MNISDPESSLVAIIYGRVSTDSQQDSLNLQEKHAVEYVKRKNFALHSLQLDEAESGALSFLERPAARRLMAALRQHPEIKHFVVGNVDRLGRTSRDNHNIFHEIVEKLGVNMHILDFFGRQIDTTNPSDYLMFSILSDIAQHELSMIRTRIRKRVNENFGNRLLIGTPPYGYDLEKYGEKWDPVKKVRRALYRLVDNLSEQSIIRRMARQRAARRSYQQIAQQLNLDGIPTKTPKSTRIKLRIGRNGEPDIWAEATGLWQSGNVAGVLQSKHTARFLAEEAAQAKNGPAQVL